MAVWVVTGANRGLGARFVEVLSARGDTVFAGARDPTQVPDSSGPGAVHPLPLDVRNDASVDAFANAIAASTGHVDVLLNNAGVADGRWSDLSDVDPATMLDVFDVNTVGPLRTSRALWGLLLKAPEGGRIAHISSLMGSIEDCASGRSYAYRPSKTALNMVSKILAVEGTAHGITSTAYHPGWVKTDMGGEHAPLSIEESVGDLLGLIDRQDASVSGGFLEHTGRTLPW